MEVVVDGRLQESVLGRRLDQLIAQFIELFSGLDLESLVNEVVRYTLLTFRLGAHECAGLLLVDVDASLEIFKGRLLQSVYALVDFDDRRVEELVKAVARDEAPPRNGSFVAVGVTAARMVAAIRSDVARTGAEVYAH